MTTAVLAVPSPPPPDPTASPGWERLRVLWRDTNGVEWDLTDPYGGAGAFLKREGVRGLGHTKPRHYRDSKAGQPGVSYRGTSYEARDVFWPLHMFHDGSTREYIRRDDLFSRGLRPERTGTWVVESPGVSKRYLDIRFDDDGDWAPEFDPTFYGWTTYGLRFTAETPFWYGDPVVRLFTQATPQPFHGGLTPGSPILRISRKATLATATIDNPGDLDAWVVWKLNGPFTSGTVAVDGKVIEVPFGRAAGQSLTIDARPNARTAIDDTGADRYDDLGQIAWGTVPAGSSVPLALELAGLGSVEATLIPQYHRAWGAR